ncbi:hypothetical protein MMC13_000067 [Lambiella insularis]|nr:hypothetical protein [Lambiella insularis]
MNASASPALVEDEATAKYNLLYQNQPQLPVDGKELRLVVLHPGQHTDPVICSLVQGNLVDSDYEALSYTWEENNYSGPLGAEWENEPEWEDVDDSELADDVGVASGYDGREVSEQVGPSAFVPEIPNEHTLYEHITINGIAVLVKSNLEHALRHLRYESKERILWIDYLCINQGSVSDRNAQVRKMDQIYSNALQVVIWLGLPSDDSDKGLDEVHALTANVHLSQLYSAERSQSQLLDRIKPVVHLLSRSWFQRVWVVQEVVLAPKAVAQVGSRTVPWDWFVKAARAFQNHTVCCAETIRPFVDGRGGDYFLNYRDCWASVLALDLGARGSTSLHMALRLFYNRKSSDSRDKVYALLGLLKVNQRLLVPNYALSPSEIYEDTALEIINSSKDLSILMDIDEMAGDVDAPTWCPDWTTNSVTGPQIYEYFNAAGTSIATVQRCAPRTMKVQGLIFDTITRVIIDEYEGTSDSELWEANLLLRRWETLARIYQDGESPYASGGSRKEAFWQTVMMGLRADRTRLLRDRDFEDYKKWRAWLEDYASKEPKHRNSFLKKSSRKYSNIRNHNAVLVQYPAVRWFFLTEDGYMGLGPVRIEPGDVVCVLAGGKTPFVLRAIDETCEACQMDQCCYCFMGFAYVPGIMHGETVAGIGRNEEEWNEFCLR